MIRLGVLASGGGTNLQALLDACAAPRLRGGSAPPPRPAELVGTPPCPGIDAEVAVVVCNVPGAGALGRAERAGVPTELLPSKGVTDREAYDLALVEALRRHRVDLVCLAGYMKLVTPAFLRAFGPTEGTRGCPRVLNVHPGLLPAFPGLHAARQALAYGARIAGCTVHFVDEGTDTGPIIAQAVVPVLPGDDEATLSARIQAQEHRLYPQAVQWFARGRLALEGRRVSVDGLGPGGPPALLNPPLDG